MLPAVAAINQKYDCKPTATLTYNRYAPDSRHALAELSAAAVARLPMSEQSHCPPDLRILLVDDHPLFASGLTLVLQSILEDAEVAACARGSDALRLLDSGSVFNVIVVDLDLPDIGGIELLDAFRARVIMTPVVVISGTNNQADIQRALDHGALGFIPKSSRAETVRAGIRAALDGQLFLPEDLWPCVDLIAESATAFAHPARGELREIGPRQIEVLQLVRQGYTNQRIAEILDITVATVKSHLGTAFRALNVRSRTACVRAAQDAGLLR